MANIYEVAERAGVSVATVSRVINNRGKVSPATAKRVKKIIAEIGFTPSYAARALTTKRSNLVGVIISDISNPFYPAVARGIQDTCLDAGYNVLMCNTDEKTYLLNEYVSDLCNKQVDGLIIQAFLPEDYAAIKTARKAGIETVLISDPGDLDVSAVYSDDTEGAFIGTCHLVDIGHQRIAFFGGAESSEVTKRRLAGYENALRQCAVHLAEDSVLFESFSLAGGAKMAAAIANRKNRPTAIFAANDMIAVGAMQWFHENGIKVPDEIAVVGFDDIDLSRYTSPKLSTVANPQYELGHTAGSLLLSRLKHPENPQQRVVLKTRLVIRESTLLFRGQTL